MFYNKALVKKYGGDPNNMPKTFADFEQAATKLRANAPDDVPIINLGNKDGYEALHAFGMVQGAYVTGQYMRNWIFHAPNSTYESPANIKALTTFQKWFKDGYLRQRLQRGGRERRRGRRSPRARACSTSAATGRPRSSSPASRTTPGS